MLFNLFDNHPLIMTLVFFLLVVFSFTKLDAYFCASKWEKSSYKSQWSVSTGCLVDINGRWIPAKTAVVV